MISIVRAEKNCETALKSKYENLKKRTKEKFAAEKANIKKTGGRPHEEKKITQLEYDVKELIGIQLTGTQSMFDDDRGKE
ncbi:hypothetical protein MML48_2g00018846 [Holotrichia oblita]|uniref:Uncharacterized protein n=1 Tax=Holotrichia oblita TaxID=644536 RepID=A0ACB9TQA6_HOLOL|nr:hypothetical protein MML48_2g00018846 [Holotrichia oblita]